MSFLAAPDYESPTDAGANNVYDVTVQVSDGAGGTDTQAIAVTVTNVNEAPVLTLPGCRPRPKMHRWSSPSPTAMRLGSAMSTRPATWNKSR